MKYIALIYSDPSKEPAYGTPEFDTFMSGYFALSAKLKADGVYIAGDGLENASTATTLRIRGRAPGQQRRAVRQGFSRDHAALFAGAAAQTAAARW